MDHEYIQDSELRRSGGYQDLKSESSAAVFAAKG